MLSKDTHCHRKELKNKHPEQFYLQVKCLIIYKIHVYNTMSFISRQTLGHKTCVLVELVSDSPHTATGYHMPVSYLRHRMNWRVAL
jgi:hypothetical protein